MPKKYMGVGQDQNSTKIANVTDPTSAQDASTKAYTDLWIPAVNQRTTDTATINSTTLVTLCTVTLTTGTYYFETALGIVGNGTASSPAFGLQGTAVTSAWRWNASMALQGTGASASGTTLGNSTSGTTIATLGTNTVENSMRVVGTFTISTGGTIIAALSRGTGSGTFVGKAASILRVDRIS